MRVLVIDNFDSFTYNLVQYFGELGAEVLVFRNNAVKLAEVGKIKPDAVVISPGPGTPDQAGITLALIQEFAGQLPMLGVCLGHQALAQAFGGKVVRAPELLHGKTSQILHDARGLFEGMENPFAATRYHSLMVEKESLPACLRITARTHNDIIMGLAHREHSLFGVQFHPESFLTKDGKVLLSNFLKIAGRRTA